MNKTIFSFILISFNEKTGYLAGFFFVGLSFFGGGVLSMRLKTSSGETSSTTIKIRWCGPRT
jgi:hypothetical protein